MSPIGAQILQRASASITVDPAVLQRFAVDGKPPQCVLNIQVDTVYFQCARAIQRSRLWQPVAPDARPAVPTAGTILAALTQDQIDGQAYDAALPARQQATLY